MSANKKTVFEGCASAIITPFKNGEVDFAGLGNIIEYQIQGNADAIVVCGTTGESATLNDSERRDIINFSVRKSAGRIPVIAGTGCNNINKAVELSRFASECGADAVMTVTPYYNKASASGLIKSFTAIADAVTVPVILYNVPSRTGIDIPLEVYSVLSGHQNICAVKEASGNIVSTERIIEKCGDSLDVYSGNDDMTVPVISVGGKGVVSVVSNIIPDTVHNMCMLALNGKNRESSRIQLELLELINVLFSEVNPIPIKSAMAMLGLCDEEMRLPLCGLDADKKTKLEAVLKKYGILK